MKYSELISFKPIESTIQLLETADKKVAQDMVQTYVILHILKCLTRFI